MRTHEIEQQEAELKAKLEELAAQKAQQEENEKAERLDQIAGYEEQANIYRQQAVKALSDDDKQRLYRYADDAETQANELRKELGLITPEQVDKTEEKDNKVRGLLTHLLRKSQFCFLAYLIGDFASAQIEAGFFSFALKSTASVLFMVSVVLGGSWLAYSAFSPFLGKYFTSELQSDFRQAGPLARLFLVLGILASFLFVLATLADVH
ncbi:hypothetical protein [Spirosoma linguale]|uniref:Uncharacterized protein n=1 Tax=Spirosoma linguale (strain ATCC 33905 / DSM 74 / LMG 10896 / Claus 1) TaxID=504472 RepID=D2QGD4_SPILD|nr:hypothetical protein Slin_0678 [Spirosoma linguale DSM 74]